MDKCEQLTKQVVLLQSAVEILTNGMGDQSHWNAAMCKALVESRKILEEVSELNERKSP